LVDAIDIRNTVAAGRWASPSRRTLTRVPWATAGMDDARATAQAQRIPITAAGLHARMFSLRDARVKKVTRPSCAPCSRGRSMARSDELDKIDAVSPPGNGRKPEAGQGNASVRSSDLRQGPSPAGADEFPVSDAYFPLKAGRLRWKQQCVARVHKRGARRIRVARERNELLGNSVPPAS